ncbi:MAG: DUF1992 domain-containing protein [Chloroflexota bacterium]
MKLKAWLLRMYPLAWRQRYGDEFLALLDGTGVSPLTVLDCARGALDAHLRSQAKATGGDAPEPVASPDAPATELSEALRAAESPAARGRPVIGSLAYESAVDQILRRAVERGEFDNLPGTGKPLDLEDNPLASDWAMAYRILKNAGETLPWIALGKEIDADRARLQRHLDHSVERLARLRRATRTDAEARFVDAERKRERTRYLEQAANLDAKLVRFSGEAPSWRLDRGRLPPHLAAARFDAACPEVRDRLESESGDIS